MTQAPAIEISNLRKQYDRRGDEKIVAVNDLNLRIEPGQVFGFLGANGAGKTTTIKMICGLVKPTSGEIRLNGYHVAKQRGNAMRQIGAVLEGTRNVYWRLTAWENLMYFGRLKGVTGKVLKDRAQLLLEELDLWERRDDKIRTFSRGMQQKVAIACALISDPPIVLLDEPTLGLDVKAALTVKQWILKLANERRKTIILTTHQLDMAQVVCDRVAIINKGRLVTNQPTDELLGLFRKSFYEIKVQGHLNGNTLPLSDGLTIREEDNNTIVSAEVVNQMDLFAMIEQVRAIGLHLISVNPVEPDLEEIFMKYMDTTEMQGV